MSTTIAHPGQIPSSGPSRRGVLSVLVGAGLVAAAAFGLFARSSDDGSSTQAELSGSISVVDEAADIAQIQQVKEMVRFNEAEAGVVGAAIDSVQAGYLAPESVSATDDYLSSGFELESATSASDSQAGLWQAQVDFLTKQYQAQSQASDDPDIAPHFVE